MLNATQVANAFVPILLALFGEKPGNRSITLGAR